MTNKHLKKTKSRKGLRRNTSRRRYKTNTTRNVFFFVNKHQIHNTCV